MVIEKRILVSHVLPVQIETFHKPGLLQTPVTILSNVKTNVTKLSCPFYFFKLLQTIFYSIYQFYNHKNSNKRSNKLKQEYIIDC